LSQWVALLRGINVGGSNKVPMTDLRRLAEGLGWTGVRSYIASANLIFEAEAKATPDGLAALLRAEMVREMGVDVPILVLTADRLRAALADCPFEPEEGRHVHAMFLWSEPVLRQDRLEDLRRPTEALVIRNGVAWLHTPDGFGISKLAERIGSVVSGTEMTGRNLNTLRKLAEMLD